MTKHDKADEARKGLIDSVKGKAKELVGAVTRNDSLTAEGQLEQTQAQQRKEANALEAVADAEAAQARAEATEAKVEGAEERLAVDRALAPAHERRDHVLGGHLLAVVEADALSELEGVDEPVPGDGVALGEHREWAGSPRRPRRGPRRYGSTAPP